jgi:hypothetical protein
MVVSLKGQYGSKKSTRRGINSESRGNLSLLANFSKYPVVPEYHYRLPQAPLRKTLGTFI